MRLTLRTMLAYLDDVLEPSNAQEIGKKIEQSEFASNLVHRIRAAIRRIRLAAPSLDAKGMGMDPNTVAEYLDSTLPQERMPDFERLCLESESHLAEAASCHQILTLVLGEPADVPGKLRERMYQIEAETEKRRAHAQTHTKPMPKARPVPGAAASASGVVVVAGDRASANGNAHAQAVVGDGAPAVTRATHEVPDYLRNRSQPLWLPIVATIAGAFLLALGGLRLLGPFNENHPLLGSLLASRGDVQSVADLGSGETKSGGSADFDGTKQAGDAESGAKLTDSGNNIAGPSSEDANPPHAAGADATERRMPVEPEPLPPQPPDPTRYEPATGDTGEAQATEPPAGGRGVVGGSSPPEPDTARVPDSPMMAEIGRFVSEAQLLVRLDEASGAWMRVPSLGTLNAGDRLVSLPAFRPQIALTSGVQARFLGESDVEVRPPDADGSPSLAINHGRLLVFFADGKAGGKIHLDLGGTRGQMEFEGGTSVLAIEVRKYHHPGGDPEQQPALIVAQLFAVSGEIQWQPADQSGPISIPVGHAHAIVDGKPRESVESTDVPGWTDPDRDRSEVDRMGARSLEPLVDTRRAVTISLMERVEHRQHEVRSLAARCLAALDLFDPVLEQINDRRQKARLYWSPAVDSLHAAVARGPETAAKLRADLERRRAADAKAMYRILWGYSPEQLDSGGGKELVGLLEHKSMDVRVLAFDALIRITGRMRSFQPEKDPEQSKKDVRAFREELNGGHIKYPVPPEPLPPRKPSGVKA